MAGLDFLSSDEAQLGLAMLAAAGPTPYNMSFGQRLAGAMQQAQAMSAAKEDRATKRELTQSQIAENKAQAKFREQELALAAKKQAGIDAWLARARGGGPAAAPGGLMAGPPGSAPPVGLLAPDQAPQGLLSGLTPDMIAEGAVMGVPGISGVTEAMKLQQPDMIDLGGGYWANKKTLRPGVNEAARAAQLQLERDKSDIAAGRQRIKYRDPVTNEEREGWADEVDPRRSRSPAPAATPSAPTRPLIGPSAARAGGPGVRGNFTGTAEEIMAQIDAAPVSAAVKNEMRQAYANQVTGNNPAFDPMGTGAAPPPAGPLIGPGAVPAPASGAPGVKVGLSPDEQVDFDARKAGAVQLAKDRAEKKALDEANLPKNIAKQRATIAQADRVMSKVDEALDQVGTFTTGTGSLLAGIPGTSAKNLAKTLETIKANLGFAELQAMRDASPTGGALGAIAVQELEALQSTIASLDQGQGAEQMKRNLGQIRKHYDAWKKTTMETPIPGAPPAPPQAPPAPAPAPRETPAAPAPSRAFTGRVGAPGSVSAAPQPMTWEAAKAAGGR